MSSWWEKYYRRGFFARKIPVPVEPILELGEMFENLASIQDEEWGRYAFRSEILRDRFDNKQKQGYTARANDCGIEYAQKMIQEFNTRDPEELAVKLGGKVSYPSHPGGSKSGSQLIFAQFVEPNEIMVFTDCTDRVNDAVEEYDLKQYISEDVARKILLAHEVFHLVEFKNKSTIYTQTEKVDVLPLKIIHNWSTIRCLSEMASMRFAKELLSLGFSPYILDVFLLYLYEQQKASDLYRAIMRIIYPERNTKN